MKRFLAFCTKGLEFVSENGISTSLPNSNIEESLVKKIIFDYDGEFFSLSDLKTIDDVGFLVAELKNVDNLAEEIVQLDFSEAKEFISRFRKFDKNKFSLTVSLIGQNFSQDEFKEELAEKFVEKYGWEYLPRNHNNFDIRVTVDYDRVFISVRVFGKPLYERDYKQFYKKGSLRSTIAASLIHLARNPDLIFDEVDNFFSDRLVDNTCGSGTILCEGLKQELEVWGGDIDPESVELSIQNLKNLDYDFSDRLKELDCTSFTWRADFFDCAVSNLPYGKQVKLSNINSLYEGCVREYARIVKDDGVIVFLLTNPDLMVKYAKDYLGDFEFKRFQVGFLGQTPWVLVMRRS